MNRKSNRDYGRRGRIGLVTPQANPTAEPEIQLLLPAGVTLHTSRAISQAESRQRFLDYFQKMERPLAAFDTLELDAVGFACTASSYLLEPSAEKEKLQVLETEFGYPVITAAGAIKQAMEYLGAESIALACPYPQWLFDYATRYWSERCYQIVDAISIHPEMGDTRAIYNVSGRWAATRLAESLERTRADLVVITGTGMPGLQPLITLQQACQRPVVTSNLCLAWACLTAAGIPLAEHQPTAAYPLLGGWEEQLVQL